MEHASHLSMVLGGMKKSKETNKNFILYQSRPQSKEQQTANWRLQNPQNRRWNKHIFQEVALLLLDHRFQMSMSALGNARLSVNTRNSDHFDFKTSDTLHEYSRLQVHLGP